MKCQYFCVVLHIVLSAYKPFRQVRLRPYLVCRIDPWYSYGIVILLLGKGLFLEIVISMGIINTLHREIAITLNNERNNYSLRNEIHFLKIFILFKNMKNKVGGWDPQKRPGVVAPPSDASGDYPRCILATPEGVKGVRGHPQGSSRVATTSLLKFTL
jgi:hypothetical protein